MSSTQEAEAVATTVVPAGRASNGQLERQIAAIDGAPVLKATIDALPDVVLILNCHRQIVAANKTLCEWFRLAPDEVLGRRPGDLLGCTNTGQGPDGCGTSQQCMTCGAVSAVLESQQTGRQVIRECRIRFEDPIGAMDLKVTASAIELDGDRFTICALQDISDQKRLALLTHLFFHDIVNTVGTIQGYAHLLQRTAPAGGAPTRDLQQLASLADQLVEEIRAQRDLTYAESGDLKPDLEPVNSQDLLQRLRLAYTRHPVGRQRHIQLSEVWNGNFVTDHRLLARVLGNMLKNALEATPPGGTVSMACTDLGNELRFTVHNSVVIPEEVQLQIFQRSFSTKATSGRGVGTHSMKLFGERYLGGKVAFTSCEPEGTTFTITLPKATIGRVARRAAK